MQKISPGQIAFVLLMAVLLMFVLPMHQSKTGKSLSQILFGSFKKEETTRALAKLSGINKKGH